MLGGPAGRAGASTAGAEELLDRVDRWRRELSVDDESIVAPLP